MWLKKTGYKNPVNPSDGLFQAAFHTDALPFPWLGRPENKEHLMNGITFFEGSAGSHPSWVTWFPVREKLLDGKRDDAAPLLVNMAGGRGQSLKEFLEAFPDEKGQFVLQDQQPVLESAESLPNNVEKCALDLLNGTPVPGKISERS
jgi:hypothetical protein